MKNLFIAVLTFCFLTQANAQITNAFEDGFTVQELEEIFENIDYKNHKKWLKKQGYEFVEDHEDNGFFEYKKNDAVSLILFYKDKTINEICFHSSPQKYYPAVSKIDEDNSYRKVEETIKNIGKGDYVNKSVWVKNGNVYYAKVENNNVGMYKDNGNMAKKPTVKKRNL